MGDFPGSVLFACTHNAIRSPMAEGILKHLFGNRIYIDSVGVRAGELDPFAVAVTEEIGIDISSHRTKAFGDLEDTYFDLVISLSPEAQHQAVEMTRTMAAEVEYWKLMDPSYVHGNREERMKAYRDVRDALLERITQRFGGSTTPEV